MLDFFSGARPPIRVRLQYPVRARVLQVASPAQSVRCQRRMHGRREQRNLDESCVSTLRVCVCVYEDLAGRGKFEGSPCTHSLPFEASVIGHPRRCSTAAMNSARGTGQEEERGRTRVRWIREKERGQMTGID